MQGSGAYIALFNVCSNISNFQFSLRPATWIISSINPTQDHEIYYIIQVYIGILPKGMVKLSPNSLWDGQFVLFLGNKIISVVSNPPPWWQLESFIQPTRVSGFHKVNSSQTSSPTPFHVATAISVLSSQGAGDLMILKTFPTFWLSFNCCQVFPRCHWHRRLERPHRKPIQGIHKERGG